MKPRTKQPPHVALARTTRSALEKLIRIALAAGCDPGLLAQTLEAAAARLLARPRSS